MDSREIKILLISAAIVVGIRIIKWIVNAITNKGIEIASNTIAEKKNREHTNAAGEERRLSDLYKDDFAGKDEQ